uniref:Uncharacterized protein n=1 Tax=Glossina palpalis gambiensis TaxID=67801 RepID=A0A1B0C7Q0_9MUSC
LGSNISYSSHISHKSSGAATSCNCFVAIQLNRHLTHVTKRGLSITLHSHLDIDIWIFIAFSELLFPREKMMRVACIIACTQPMYVKFLRNCNTLPACEIEKKTETNLIGSNHVLDRIVISTFKFCCQDSEFNWHIIALPID